jgi:hypothetical protein
MDSCYKLMLPGFSDVQIMNEKTFTLWVQIAYYI